MRSKNKNRKRPCRICGKWFTPNPRLGERQRTCGDTECKRQWHAKKCREWNRKNRSYFEEIYLEQCLAACGTGEKQAPTTPGDKAESAPLPARAVQEVISIQQFVIIRYFIGQSFRRFQEVIDEQLIEFTQDRRRIPSVAVSRGDSRSGPD